jgi:hypothetical protein
VKLWRSVVAHKPSRQLLVLKTGSQYSIGPGERQPFPVSQSSWSGSKQRPSPREGSALSGRPTVWPTSVRNRWPGSIGTGGRLQIGISGRLQVGIGGRLTSETAGIPLTPPTGLLAEARHDVSDAEAHLAALVAQRPALDANVNRCRADREHARAEHSRHPDVEHAIERFVPATVRSPMKSADLPFLLVSFFVHLRWSGTLSGGTLNVFVAGNV